MATNTERYIVWIVIVFGLFQVYSTAPVADGARLGIVEHLLNGILTRDLVEIKDELRNLNLKKVESNCCNASKPKNEDETWQDLLVIQELANHVEKKLFAMGKAFSAEKKQLRDDKNDIFEIIDGLNMSLNVLSQHFDEIEGRVMPLEKLPNAIGRNRESITELYERIQGLTSQVTILDNLPRELEHDRESMTEANRRITELEEQLGQLSELVNKEKTGRDTFEKSILSRVEIMIKGCPNGWERQFGSCIWYSDVELSWANAAEHCMYNGGILAEPYTQEAFAIIINNMPEQIKYKLYWIGASDLVEEGVFVWKSTGRSIGEMVWGEGEPNNNNDEDCVELVPKGHINDNDCDKTFNFICEIKL